MVKAKATRLDGSVLIVMGISDGNVAALLAGRPIYFDPAQLKIEPGTTIAGITLFYAATDAELTKTIGASLGPNTEVKVIPKGDTRPQ